MTVVILIWPSQSLVISSSLNNTSNFVFPSVPFQVYFKKLSALSMSNSLFSSFICSALLNLKESAPLLGLWFPCSNRCSVPLSMTVPTFYPAIQIRFLGVIHHSFPTPTSSFQSVIQFGWFWILYISPSPSLLWLPYLRPSSSLICFLRRPLHSHHLLSVPCQYHYWFTLSNSNYDQVTCLTQRWNGFPLS